MASGKRRAPRLTRLRKTVSKWNFLYGLLVQALDTLQGRLLDLENRYHIDEKETQRQLEAEELELAALAGWIAVA
jgi:hypothetical protein